MNKWIFKIPTNEELIDEFLSRHPELVVLPQYNIQLMMQREHINNIKKLWEKRLNKILIKNDERN